MRPLLPILLAGALLAALPGPALAKGVSAAQTCGADGCTDVDGAALHGVLPDADTTVPPTAGAPFVTVRLMMQGGPEGPDHHERYTYVPGRGLIHFDGAPDWMLARESARARLDELAAGVRPLPAAQLAGVEPAATPDQPAAAVGDGTPWWTIAGAGVALLVLLALLARYATSALKARPRASKSAN